MRWVHRHPVTRRLCSQVMASPAQDVWSFGAVAYELMAAEPIFASDVDRLVC